VVAYSGSTRAVGSARRLNTPRPALVLAHADGSPVRVNHQDVALVQEEWRVVDRWWTEDPLSRRYFQLVLATGQHAIVFRDEHDGKWFLQNA
jgi:hypothetical protein